MAGNKAATLVTGVKGCARCGQDHADVKFRKLSKPIPAPQADVADVEKQQQRPGAPAPVKAERRDYDWWAMCPTNREPIVMHIRIDPTQA